MRRRRHRSGKARRRFPFAANRTRRRRCRSSGRSRCLNHIRSLGRCPRCSQNTFPRDWTGCTTRTCHRMRSRSTHRPRRTPRRRRWHSNRQHRSCSCNCHCRRMPVRQRSYREFPCRRPRLCTCLRDRRRRTTDRIRNRMQSNNRHPPHRSRMRRSTPWQPCTPRHCPDS